MKRRDVLKARAVTGALAVTGVVLAPVRVNRLHVRGVDHTR